MGWRDQATLVLLLAGLVLASSARVEQQADLLVGAAGRAEDASRSLNTYYFDVSKPVVALSTRGSGRAGRTALTVKMSEASVSKYMPVVSPKLSGMTHTVSNTWSALQGLATMFTRVRAINANNPSGPRLFPRSALAITAAADNAPARLDVASFIQATERHGHLSAWTETTPASVLLLPAGRSTGAVADVLDVSYDAAAGSVTLEVDLVSDPHTMSEFEPHGKQTMEVDEAHYHFLTAPGVRVDAQALLKSLQDNQFQLEGLHVFMKGGAPPTCLGVTLTTDTPVPPANSIVNITITLDGSNCNETSPRVGPASVPADQLNVPVELVAVGDAQWAGGSASPQAVVQGLTGTNTIYVNGGVGYALLNGNGPVTVTAVHVGGQFSGDVPAGSGNLIINIGGGGNNNTACAGPVSKLMMLPLKARKHVHDPVKFTVLAVDASGDPVANATITVSLFGGKTAGAKTTTVTTDAEGEATFSIISDHPGVSSVVAAAINPEGQPVTAPPAHIIFKGGSGYDSYSEEAYLSDRGDAEGYEAAVQQAFDNTPE